MINKKKILAIIPARGGSKSIKKKNLVKINKIPLIKYTINAALNSNYLDEIVVSSDDEEIINYSIKQNVLAPFVRPKNLSTDNAKSLPVIKHAIKFMEKIKSIKYEYILMLQPTSPFRSAVDIDKCIKLLSKSNHLDSVVSVVNVGANHPYRMKIIKNNYLKNFFEQGFEDMRPRQKLPSVYIRNGAIYLNTRTSIFTNNSLVGQKVKPYIMKKNKSINIDSIEDLLIAKQYLKNENS